MPPSHAFPLWHDFSEERQRKLLPWGWGCFCLCTLQAGQSHMVCRRLGVGVGVGGMHFRESRPRVEHLKLDSHHGTSLVGSDWQRLSKATVLHSREPLTGNVGGWTFCITELWFLPVRSCLISSKTTGQTKPVLSTQNCQQFPKFSHYSPSHHPPPKYLLLEIMGIELWEHLQDVCSTVGGRLTTSLNGCI